MKRLLIGLSLFGMLSFSSAYAQEDDFDQLVDNIVIKNINDFLNLPRKDGDIVYLNKNNNTKILLFLRKENEDTYKYVYLIESKECGGGLSGKALETNSSFVVAASKDNRLPSRVSICNVTFQKTPRGIKPINQTESCYLYHGEKCDFVSNIEIPKIR